MMVSQHYPFLFSHPQSWLVVALIMLSGALVRHMLNRIDAGDDWDSYGWTLAGRGDGADHGDLRDRAAAARQTPGRAVTDAEAQAIVGKHCLTCHARNPSHPAFKEPPKNVALETIAEMRRFAQQIYMQTVQNRAMPLGNQTGMTDDERDALGRWVNGRK